MSDQIIFEAMHSQDFDIRLTIGKYTWIVARDGQWIVYHRPYRAKYTQRVHVGTDITEALKFATGEHA